MLIDALQKINFTEKFRNLTNSSNCEDGITEPDLNKLEEILKSITPDVKYFKKEKFFRLIIKEKSRIFWLHIEVSPVIKFHFYEMDAADKYVDGSPMTAFYRKLNNGDISALGKLKYCSYEEFEKIIKQAFSLCKEIIAVD